MTEKDHHVSFIIVSHANAEKPQKDLNDKERGLTAEGLNQAESMAGQLRTKFDLVFCSPTERSIATASLISGKKVKDLIVVGELYPQNIGIIHSMVMKMGHVPAERYLDSEIGKDIRRVGKKASYEILKTIFDQIEEGKVFKNILISCEPVIANMVGMALAIETKNNEAKKNLRDIYFRDGDAYRVRIGQNSYIRNEWRRKIMRHTKTPQHQ